MSEPAVMAEVPGNMRSAERRSRIGADAAHTSASEAAAAEAAAHVTATEAAAHVATTEAATHVAATAATMSTTASAACECAARGKCECCCENCYNCDFLAHDIPTFGKQSPC
jgi:hypothetical protein